ncbi:MAG: hypothetical protein ACI4QR_05925 [Eubacteriales bacterium]
MENDISEKLNAVLADPAMMEKIKLIAGSLGATQSPPQDSVNTEKHEERAFQGASSDKELPPPPIKQSEISKNIANSRALLIALKPYLDRERCERIDKILGMMKIAEIMGYIK